MDVQTSAGDSYARLADLLEQQGPDRWDRPSLCAGWRVREVIAHVTMPARLSEAQFFAELATVGGDFGRLSDTIAGRNGGLPIAEHLANLRSTTLATWQPPGGGPMGALNHAVVHGLDVTVALDLPRPCSDEAAESILGSLTVGAVSAHFGVDLAALRLAASDLEWSWGSGTDVVGTADELIALVYNRTLPSGRTLR